MILIIGPLPDPINGCSYANEILCRNLQKKDLEFQTINASTPVISSKQGSSFSIKKAFGFIITYLEIYKVFCASILYITPGQTFFGLAKYAPFILISILLNKPYIIHVHGNYLGDEYKRLKGIKSKFFYFLTSKAAAGIVLSESLKANFNGLLPNSKIHIVENFVDNSILCSNSNIIKRTDKLRLLYLSNLMEEKGIIDVIDSLILLQEKGIEFEACFAGKIEDDINTLVTIKLAKLGSKAKLLGLVTGDEKNKVLFDSNVFVLPTYYQMEGQPISILEALATGNIIITTNHAGIPDIIHSENGYFISPKSPTEITEKLVYIANNLESEIKKFSEHNSSYAAARFTEVLFFDKIYEIIVQNKKTK